MKTLLFAADVVLLFVLSNAHVICTENKNLLPGLSNHSTKYHLNIMPSKRILKWRINFEKFAYCSVIRCTNRIEGFQGFQICCSFQFLETGSVETRSFLGYDIYPRHEDWLPPESEVLNLLFFRDTKIWVHIAFLNGQSILHSFKGLREWMNKMKIGTFLRHSEGFLGNRNIITLIS